MIANMELDLMMATNDFSVAQKIGDPSASQSVRFRLNQFYLRSRDVKVRDNDDNTAQY